MSMPTIQEVMDTEILGTFKYEPHAADTAALRRALEGVIERRSHAA